MLALIARTIETSPQFKIFSQVCLLMSEDFHLLSAEMKIKRGLSRLYASPGMFMLQV